MKIKIILLALVTVLFVALALSAVSDPSDEEDFGIVTVENGVQTVEILAKGGYSPRTIQLQADLPTVLKVKTENTYDCSSALVIPELNFGQYLPTNGVTEIEIPAQEAGTSIQGTCSMGMYGFTLKFE